MTASKLLSITVKVLLSALLVVIVGALAVLTVVPRAVHGTALTVLTGSMTPTIPVGSVVVVQPVDPGTLRVGDVVTYQIAPGRAEFITHRVVAIHAGTQPVTLTTKGDANRGEDTAPVPVTAVRGKVLFHVPYLGTVRNAVGGRGALLPVAILGLLGYAVSQVVSVRGHRSGTPAASDALRLQLLVMTLPVPEFDGLPAERVATLLRMDLRDEGEEAFTVSLAGSPEQLDELVALLTPFNPLAVTRSQVLEVPWCDGPPPVEPTDRAVSRALA